MTKHKLIPSMLKLGYALICLLGVTLATFLNPSIWPQPSSVEFGTGVINVGKLDLAINTPVSTLSLAFERYNNLIFTHSSGASNATVAATKVNVVLSSYAETYPQIDTDESYTIQVTDSTNNVQITADNVYGALRALESLSQLIYYDFETEQYTLSGTPLSIKDSPRYQHRGMLLDTSRHYQPISALKRTIDALSYAKYNVLHWHVVDTQSFPFQSFTYPKLWDGAYSKQERYTQADARELVEYGRQRGVKVMIEFDMPGHARSWCTGYPEICPSDKCFEPLDPSNEATFTLIDALLSECTGRQVGGGLFPYSFIHLGGDEVDYTCWERSSHIREWEAANDMNGSEDAYEYFVNRAAGIARNQTRTPVQWVEVFEHFGANLDKNTVVHVWKEKKTMDAVIQAGYRTLLSDNDRWYLDWLDVKWQDMYLNEPTDGLSATSDPSYIIGGESCMWGETVDASDLDSTVWPRAAAVSERLWTPLAEIGTDLAVVENRLETFRCLLNQRGIGAAPVTNNRARMSPNDPGSCYAQRRRLSASA